MTRDDIIRMAGHRDVPPWVLKLVMDCVEAEREACAKAVEGYCGAWDDQGYALTQIIRAKNKQGE